jgi:hypothetical protein
MAKNLGAEEVKAYPKVFVTVDGVHELIARDDVQAAAFENAGLKEKE